RLGESSTLLALRAYRHAAEAWRRFGPEGTGRWLALGEAVATEEPACREGALAYFAVPPAALGGPDGAAAWCDLGRAVARVSRRLAATFFERTAPVLGRPDGIERLRAWVDAGLGLHDTRGWRGAFLAQAYFDAAPGALAALGPADYRAWAETGAALSADAEVRGFFAAGTAVAAENAAAGRAYFALESRTSLAVLRAASTAAALEDTQGVWRKLVQMLSGAPVVVRGVEVATLRPPLEDLPAEHEVALPLLIDCLPPPADNCRVYRLLAAVLAGRREFGTYAHPDLRARVCAPELLEDLFL